MDPTLLLSLSVLSKTAVLSAVGLITLLQFVEAEREFPAPAHGRWPWHMHHDEKILVHDARVLWGRNRGNARLMDYRPYPVSAAYGLGGPLLAAAGLRLFGLTNLGLRAPFILFSGITNLFACLALLEAVPGPVGFILCSVHLFSWSQFILGRHAILENVLNAFLASALWLYFTDSDFFVHQLPWLGGFAAATILFKPNFLIYVHLMLLSVIAVEHPSPTTFSYYLIFSGLGFLVVEGLQMLWLSGMGIARHRYFNLFRALRQHAGRDVQVLQSFNRDGLHIFPKYLQMLVEWYHPGPLSAPPFGKARGPLIFVLAFLCFLFVSFAAAGTEHRETISALLLFLLAYLGLSSLFFFYTKRAVSTFPVLLVLFGTMVQAVLEELPAGFFPPVETFLWAVTVLLSVFLLRRLLMKLRCPGSRTDGVRRNSRSLAQAVPPGARVYAHCYAGRFFWQSAEIRFFSADDQIMDNQMIVDWALADEGDFVLLASRGGQVSLSAAGRLGFLERYESSNIESDLEDQYVLCRVLKNGQPREAFPPKTKSEIGAARACPQNGTEAQPAPSDARPPAKPNLRGIRLLAKLREAGETGVIDQAEEIMDLVRAVENRTALGQALRNGQPYVLVPEDEGTVSPNLLSKIRHIATCRDGTASPLSLFEVTDHCDDHSDLLNAIDSYTLKRLYQHASHLKNSGHYDLATDLFRLAYTNGFHPSGVSFHLGELALFRRDPDNARAHFKECLRHEPNHRSATLRLMEMRSDGRRTNGPAPEKTKAGRCFKT